MKHNDFSSTIASFFKDRNGNVVIWQWPNVPLMSWLIFKILSMVIKTSNIKGACENLSMAFLFTWAYLEITSGKSYFRRTLGAVIMIALIIGFLKRG